MHGSAGTKGTRARPRAETQGIQITAAPVPHRGQVTIGACRSCERGALDQFDRRATPAQLFDAVWIMAA